MVKKIFNILNLLLPSRWMRRLSKTQRNYVHMAVGAILVLLIPMAIATFRTPPSAEAAWLDDSWGYRQRVDISNAGTVQTDFQVSFALDTNTLFDNGKLQSDCDDIRITDTNGKLLPYWIEQMATACGDSNSAQTIWVKAPTVAAASSGVTTTLYVYYGNPSASIYSDGNRVFEFFDDFSGSTLNPNKWAASGAYSVSGGAITITTGSVYTNSTIVSTGQNYIYESRQSWTQISNVAGLGIAATQGLSASNTNGDRNILYLGSTTVAAGWASSNGSSGYNVASNATQFTPTTSTNYIFSFSMDGTNIKYYQDRTQTNSYTGTWSQAPYLYLGYYQGNQSSTTNGNDVVADWVIARKFAATAPSSASPTNEEKGTGPVVYLKLDEGTGTALQDSTSNNLDGVTNSSTWKTEQDCISGKCLEYNSSGSFSISDNDKLDFGTNSFSVQMWGRYHDFTYPKAWFMAKKSATGYAAGNPGWDIGHGYNANGINITYSDGTTGYTNTGVTFDSGFRPTDLVNKWAMLTVVFDKSANKVKFYVNGVKQTNEHDISGVTGSVNNGSSVSVGTMYGWLTDGQIDDFKIYPFALTATQIKVNYSSKTGENSSVLGSDTKGQNLSTGLVGHWKMDETSWTSDCATEEVLDASGNSNNGESCPSADANDPVAGKFGNAGDFDGTNDYVAIDNTSSLNPTAAVTVSTWIYDDSISGRSPILTNGGGPTGLGNIYFAVESATPRIAINQNWSTANDLSAGTITASTWNHIVGVFDGQKLYIYVNGALAGSQTSLSSSITSSSSSFTIGANQSFYHNGRFDETRMYNRALSPDEVSQLYNFAPGPVGYWKMEEGTGTSTVDSSGNGSTGTLTGSPTWTTGKYGKAVNFNDTTGQYVSVTNNFIKFGPTSSFTLEAWFYKNADQGSNTIFMQQGLPNNFSYGLLGNVGGTVTAQLCKRDVACNSTSNTAALALNTWHYASLTFDGTTLSLYVNGVFASSTTWTQVSVGTADSSAYIGNDSATSGREFNGRVDDVKIYNYVRTAKQIVEDMNAGHPNVGSPVGSAVGHWKFDEGYGTTANNAGNGGSTYNATLTNMASPATSTSGWTQSGKIDKAVNFGGDNDSVSIPANDTTKLVNDSTVSMWVYVRSVGPNGYTELYAVTGGNHSGFHLQRDLMRFPTPGAFYTYYVPMTTVVDTWYHVTAVFDRTNLKGKAYLNGVYQGEVTLPSYTPTGTAVNMGGNFWTGNVGDFANAMIDDVKLYNYALTASEVKLDYNRSSAQVLGSISDKTGTGYEGGKNAANQEYCVPGDSTSCTAPLGRWDIEEGTGTTTNDKSGNANIGTLTSSPTWTIGNNGNGLKFNDSYVDVANESNFDFTSNFTISLLLNVDAANNTAYRGVMGKYQGDATGWDLGVQSNNLRMTIRGTSSIDTSTGGSTLASNTWYHVEIVNTPTDIKIYINGILDRTVAGTWTATTNNHTVWFGDRGDGTTGFLGKLDNVRIFNYARSAAQIAWDYNKGGPVGHWRFDECQGTTANDSSGNSNSGTITIGGTGTHTSAGTCPSGTATHAWAGGVAGAGKRNYALSFDGTDDKVTAGSVTLGTNMTIAGWIKKTASTGQKSFFSNRSTGAVYFGLTTTQVFLYDNGGTPPNITSATGSIQIGQWQHVVATSDGSTTKFYVNGIQVTSTAQTRTSSSGTVGIGWDPSIGTEYWDGQIDDVRVYNYNLTATQVKSLYNDGAAVRYGPVTGAP